MTNREMELERKVRDLESHLKSVRRELGYVLDALIELLPRQNPNYFSEYAIILARIRDIIKDIESLE